MPTASTKKISLLASAGLLLTSIIWGFAFVIVKNSLDLIPPIYMLAFRFTIGALGLVLIFHRKLKAINIPLLRSGAILGFFLFISYAVQTIGCKYTTAGKNAFITTIYVVLVPFLHWFINRKKPDLFCLLAAASSFAGIALLSLDGSGGGINIGDILTLLCGVGYAIHFVFLDRYAKLQDPVCLTLLQIAFAAIFSWICAPIMDGGFPANAFQPGIIAGMLYLGLMSTMTAFLLQTVCQKYTSATTASLILSTECVFGVFFSILLLGEHMSGRMAAGCVLILLAIVITETKPDLKRAGRKKTKQDTAA
ncbi:DMT family transporter [Anaerolentibacter hominis]|uniref:DMT family transporter n=1 Tax=Anaerolentibacter hominis TaxID=3079009 RepID=UPI0031B897F4